MDQSYLLVLGLAILVALGAGARIRNRMVADRAGAVAGGIAVRRLDRGAQDLPEVRHGQPVDRPHVHQLRGPAQGLRPPR